MERHVVSTSEGHRLAGPGGDIVLANQFLARLASRAFSPATVRAYAYDLLNFLRFLAERRARLGDVVATDLFDYLAWQQRPAKTAGRRVVRLADRRGADDDEPTSRRGARPVRVRGNGRGPVRQPGAGGSPVHRPAGPATRTAWARRIRAPAWRRASGASGEPVA